MSILRRTPLAWRNLTHNARRLVVALCGIGFAVVLMFTELGFRNALFDSTVQVFEALDADIMLVSKAHQSMVSGESFPVRRVYQARACEGVRFAGPLYMQIFGPVWKSTTRQSHPIRVLAYEPGDPIFRLPAVAACGDALRQDGSALFDTKSKPKYGIPATSAEILALRGAELSDHKVRLVGTFEMGTDFVSDGTVITSSANFAKFCPYHAPGADPLSQANVGVVQVEAGQSVRQVQKRLRAMLPDDVMVFTKAEMLAHENAFWSQSTPIGYVFFLGMMIGFLVGVIICYQIIYADVSDHLPEFATLKAMGYRNPYFMGFVLQESFCLSVLSFLPGLVVSLGLYAILAHFTGLLMVLNLSRATSVFALTTAMCVVSGGLAMRRVLAADPASLY